MTEKIHVHTTINDAEVEFLCESRESLLEVLRDVLGLTGTKEGCNDGNCGACTVIMDGRIVDSCLVLAVEAEGKSIITIEGLARDGQLHPLQAAFIEHHGMQCGYCTPGMILSAKALLDENPHPTEAEIKEGIAGNLCRCGSYQKIIKSVQVAAEQMGGS